MTYATEVLADGPLGFWLLDETTGTVAYDSSGNARNGTYFGAPALASTTIATLAPTPTFVNDWVFIPAIDVGTGPYTLEAVARMDAAVYQAEVFGEEFTGGNNGILASIGTNLDGTTSNNKIQGTTYYGTQGSPNFTWYNSTSPTAWVLGAVHHLAYVFDGTTSRLYIDGVVTGTVHTRTGFASNNGWRIGGRAGFWNGTIGGVALYGTALSAARIAAHVNAVIPKSIRFTASATVTFSATVTSFASIAFGGAGSLTVSAAAEPEPATQFAAVAFGATGSLDVIGRPVGRRRRLVVTDIDGAPLGELENATCGAIKYTLNEPEDWSFTLPMSDPKAALLLGPRFREVQVWRGDQLLAWGPAVRPSADKTHLAVSCKGAGWYLSRRTIGDASRRNYLVNGDFEDGLTGWNIGALHPLEPLATRDPSFWDAETATDRVLTGGHSLYLAQVGTGAPRYGISAGQFLIWQVDPATNPEGDEWSFTARCYIPSETWRGPPVDNVGLRLDRFSTTESVFITPEGGGAPIAYPKPIETVTATIDENTPRDVWLPLEAVMVAPVTGNAEFVQVVLYCPDGAIFWDRATLTIDEGLRFHGQDQADIVAGIVEHLQDEAYAKTYLNLWTDTPATGVLRDRTYLHHEHINGADAIGEFATLANGLDISVAYEPYRRTVRTHHPARGSFRPAYALELGRNIADFAWTFDGESAASQVIVLGSGDGSDREEASATVDPLADDAYAEGLTLETVFTAPPSTLIDSLDDVAAETLAVAIAPEVLAVTCTSPAPGQADPVGVVAVGDTVPVRIRAGSLIIDETYRIVELTITPDDTLELTLNKRTAT